MAKFFTKKGLQKIKEELEHLKKIKRKEVAERLKHAASFGDLKENFAYHQAKEEQAFLEGKIGELEAAISQAKIAKTKETGKIGIGSFVTAVFDNNKVKIQIVGSQESDPLKGKISSESFVGKALLGKSAGDKIRIKTPQGMVLYEIIKIR